MCNTLFDLFLFLLLQLSGARGARVACCAGCGTFASSANVLRLGFKVPTVLPNNNAGIEAFPLQRASDGIILAYNPYVSHRRAVRHCCG